MKTHQQKRKELWRKSWVSILSSVIALSLVIFYYDELQIWKDTKLIDATLGNIMSVILLTMLFVAININLFKKQN